jgi:hypothetical protein
MTSTRARDGLTKLLVGPIAFLVMRRRRSGDPPPAPLPNSQSQGGSPDQAALLGAAFAATIALLLGEGRWEFISMLLGLTLLATVLGYFRWPPPEPAASRPATRPAKMPSDVRLKGIAYAAVFGLCVSLAATWLVQVAGSYGPIRQRTGCSQNPPEVVLFRRTANSSTSTAPPTTTSTVTGTTAPEKELSPEECIAGLVTIWAIPVVWILAGVLKWSWLRRQWHQAAVSSSG